MRARFRKTRSTGARRAATDTGRRRLQRTGSNGGLEPIVSPPPTALRRPGSEWPASPRKSWCRRAVPTTSSWRTTDQTSSAVEDWHCSAVPERWRAFRECSRVTTCGPPSGRHMDRPGERSSECPFMPTLKGWRGNSVPSRRYKSQSYFLVVSIRNTDGALCNGGPGIHWDRALMPEMPRAGENHGEPRLVGGRDHLIIAH